MLTERPLPGPQGARSGGAVPLPEMSVRCRPAGNPTPRRARDPRGRRRVALVGALAACVTTASWGGMFVAGAQALHSLPLVWLAALRYGVVGVIFMVVLAVAEGRDSCLPGPGSRTVAWLGMVGFGGFNLLVFGGVALAGPLSASLLVALMPLVTALVLWRWFGRRPGRSTALGALVAVFGVGLVLTGGDIGKIANGGLGPGHLCVLAGVTCWVVYTTGYSLVPQWSILRYTAWSSMCGGLFLVVLAVVGTGLELVPVPSVAGLRASAWSMLYIIGPASVIAVLSWHQAVRRIGPQGASLFINLTPVTTFVIEAVLGRPPQPVQVVGAMITLAALVVHNMASRGAVAQMSPHLRIPLVLLTPAMAAPRSGRAGLAAAVAVQVDPQDGA